MPLLRLRRALWFAFACAGRNRASADADVARRERNVGMLRGGRPASSRARERQRNA